MLRSVLTATLALGLAIPAVRANESSPAPAGTGGMTIEIDSGWVLDPIVTGGEILGFFGQLPASKAVGDNVTLVWAASNGDGTWNLFGWDNATAAEAVAELRACYNDPSILTATLLLDGSDANAIDDCVVPMAAESMASGLLASAAPADTGAEDDGYTPDELAELIAAGAAGAPDLSVRHITSACGDISQLSAELTGAATYFASASGATYSSARACWFCLPGVYTVWGGWSAWTCTGGPTQIAGCGGSGGCRYTGCTRSRTGTRVRVYINCSTRILGPATQTQGPQNKTCPLPPSGVCPPQPAC